MTKKAKKKLQQSQGEGDLTTQVFCASTNIFLMVVTASFVHSPAAKTAFSVQAQSDWCQSKSNARILLGCVGEHPQLRHVMLISLPNQI